MKNLEEKSTHFDLLRELNNLSLFNLFILKLKKFKNQLKFLGIPSQSL
jgi:hypothetical protein